eukprot:CAMPEP_0197826218 /NCGR_PEP_ID=MMETSP1437-20131217/3204_1 /TAXON_ID=49252 ORGANISM="Eucampia antarctica, Strain CCMP1452" /NCGR_SAMPLE_ID=MMETSP1437 /ASSEMBLY_ACC=CAM_ASM_001096 /LENGTH=75 /DNA_ID=CAMNT_0043426559 /DNA_START=68 /DNA_END=291 /DNA_ORIENTATION=+
MPYVMSDASEGVLYSHVQNKDAPFFSSLSTRRELIKTSVSAIVLTQLSNPAVSKDDLPLPFGAMKTVLSLSDAVT